MLRDHSKKLHDSTSHARLARQFVDRDAALATSALARHRDVRESGKHRRSYLESHLKVAQARERLINRHLRKGHSLDVELLGQRRDLSAFARAPVAPARLSVELRIEVRAMANGVPLDNVRRRDRLRATVPAN